jgi:ribonuclease BN (tRNA processing enzyme)
MRWGGFVGRYSMRPFLHPILVNGRTGDPALYIETLFEKETILFDLGDISNLPPRKIQRLEHVFVSHTHIDHFIGFDRLLRVLAGRQKKLNFYGPPDFIAQVQHKLQRVQLVVMGAVRPRQGIRAIAGGLRASGAVLCRALLTTLSLPKRLQHQNRLEHYLLACRAGPHCR